MIGYSAYSDKEDTIMLWGFLVLLTLLNVLNPFPFKWGVDNFVLASSNIFLCLMTWAVFLSELSTEQTHEHNAKMFIYEYLSLRAIICVV